MSADNHASYGKIGFAVLAGAIAIAVTLVYIAGIGDSQDEILVETYYDNPINGLSVGSVVNFRGVKVGEVRKIGFIGVEYPDAEERDCRKIYILMAVNLRLVGITERRDQDDVRQGIDQRIHATVASNGITGMSRIELNYPRTEMRHLALSWRPEHLFIHPAPSLFDNLTTAATKVMNQINSMNFEPVWSNVQVMAQSMSELSANASAMLESEESGLRTIIRNAEELTASFRDLAERLRDNPSILLRPNDPEPLPETDFK